MARHITRNEIHEAKKLGARPQLYRRARRAGAGHQEIMSVLERDKYLWRYELARRVGASHEEALAFLESGISPFDYQDLRRAGATHREILDVNRELVDLRFYAMARRLGIPRDEAAPLVKAGLFHATGTAWRNSAEALRELRAQGRDTPSVVERLGKLAPQFQGDARALALEAAGALDAAQSPAPERPEATQHAA